MAAHFDRVGLMMALPHVATLDACDRLQDAPSWRRSNWKNKLRIDVLAIFITIIMLLCLFTVYITSTKKIPSREANPTQISSLSYPSCGNVTNLCSNEGSCRQKRLVGGRLTNHEWPWMVEILVDGKHFCGGTLIDPGWVLTAAHCLRRRHTPLTTASISVRMGHVNRLKPEPSSQTFNVSRVIIHHAFRERTFQDDIGLLRLKGDARLDRFTWPACLPSDSLEINGETSLTGWGKTKIGQPNAPALRIVNLPIASTENCATKNRNLFPYVKVNLDKHICAGAGKSSPGYGCDGDSGGPLNWQGVSRQWIVAGVTSWGDPSCLSSADTFTVFTRVASYEEWIKSHVNQAHGATSRM